MFLNHLLFANISTGLYFWVYLGALAKANEIIRNKSGDKLKAGFVIDKVLSLKAKKEA